jgi:hypothetical protein
VYSVVEPSHTDITVPALLFVPSET